eukprot:1157933-Pelagomonas_calceolata.AAC.9
MQCKEAYYASPEDVIFSVWMELLPGTLQIPISIFCLVASWRRRLTALLSQCQAEQPNYLAEGPCLLVKEPFLSAASTDPDARFRVHKKSQAMKVPWDPSVRYEEVYGRVQDPSKIRAVYGISLEPDGLCCLLWSVWTLVTTVCRMLKQCDAPDISCLHVHTSGCLTVPQEGGHGCSTRTARFTCLSGRGMAVPLGRNHAPPEVLLRQGAESGWVPQPHCLETPSTTVLEGMVGSHINKLNAGASPELDGIPIPFLKYACLPIEHVGEWIMLTCWCI